MTGDYRFYDGSTLGSRLPIRRRLTMESNTDRECDYYRTI